MKIVLLMTGKTNQKYLQEGIDLYAKRIQFYLPFELEVIPEKKITGKPGIDHHKKQDSEAIEKRIRKDDFVILLDEKGKEFDSIDFAKYMETCFHYGKKRMLFVTGGAFGLTDELKSKYQNIAMSKMTFSHQLIRLVFVEQLYRALTIIKGESYHHE